jgi:hypothetical protein
MPFFVYTEPTVTSDHMEVVLSSIQTIVETKFIYAF